MDSSLQPYSSRSAVMPFHHEAERDQCVLSPDASHVYKHAKAAAPSINFVEITRNRMSGMELRTASSARHGSLARTRERGRG